MVVVMNFLAWGLFKLKFGRVSVRASNQMLMSEFEYYLCKEMVPPMPKTTIRNQGQRAERLRAVATTERGKRCRNLFQRYLIL